MKSSIIVFFICFSLLMSACYAKNDIKYYWPEIERLTGTVIYLTFPGRPNYTSIVKGDVAEKQPYLVLDDTIDVKMRLIGKLKVNPVYDDQYNVRLIQLIVLHLEDFKLLKEDQRITVKGNIFGAISGHHHAKVLISVEEFSIVPKKNLISTKNIKKLITNSLRDIDDYTEYEPKKYKRIEE